VRLDRCDVSFVYFNGRGSEDTFGVAPITLAATASSGLPVTFSRLSGPASLIGNVLTITGAGTVVVSANQTGNDTYESAPQVTRTLVVNPVTPTITWASPAAIAMGTALSSTQLNATASVAGAPVPGTLAYTPRAGVVLGVGVQTLSVLFTPADATNYTTATSSVSITVTPRIDSLSPPSIGAGSAAFTLIVTGDGFTSSAVVYWGATQLATTFVSATELHAQPPLTNPADAGTSIPVSVQTTSLGTSNILDFHIDSASSLVTPPTFAAATTTVTAGTSASYSVTLPSSATNVSISCLNLPVGTTCSYSSATNAVSITTSSSTPTGTYQIIVVFTETLPGAAGAFVFLPILALPLTWAGRKKTKLRRISLLVCLGLVLLAVAGVGCGGSGSGGVPNPTPQSHTVTSSAAVFLTVK